MMRVAAVTLLVLTHLVLVREERNQQNLLKTSVKT